MAETFTPPSNTSYSAVFDIVRTWLGLAEFKAERAVLDSLARNIAADMCRRDLAPAAYGDKRMPYYTHAAIGIDGVSVNLCFRDGSAEFVFREEEMDLVNEEGRDLYVRRVAASEILALRQSLIDYLPAAEGVRDRAEPTPAAPRPAVGREKIASILRRELIARRDYDSTMRPVDWIDGIDDAANAILALFSADQPAASTALAQGEAARG